MRKLIVKQEVFKLKEPFAIAHGTRDESVVVYVSISENGVVGEGESYPYARYAESVESVINQIENIRKKIEVGLKKEELQNLLPAGAARNAVDLALWDLQAKKEKKEIWEIAGLEAPKEIVTAYTLVIAEPKIMGEKARNLAGKYSILKLKLAGDDKDIERIEEVRKNAPNNQIVIDANESWNIQNSKKLFEICGANNVTMIEQPFAAKDDEILRKITTDIIICADESCHTFRDLAKLQGKYDMINIKLDKTGGLTEALKLYKKAKELNFKIMVGCMVGSSLGIIPAYFLAQKADVVDLDAPLLLEEDRKSDLKFRGDRVFIVA